MNWPRWPWTETDGEKFTLVLDAITTAASKESCANTRKQESKNSMLSVEQCRQYLKSKDLTDAQVEMIRNFLYNVCVRSIESHAKAESTKNTT